MNFKKKFVDYILKKVDKFVLDYLTVERSRNRRKFIWKTKHFRDLTQIYIPRGFFTFFIVVMCWKIHERIRVIKKSTMVPYESISVRKEKIDKENKVNAIVKIGNRIFF